MCFGELHPEERPTRWLTKFVQSDIEVGLGGDNAGPNRATEELAKACEAQLTKMVADALGYISKHAAPTSAVSGEPEIQWIDFGLSNYGQHQEFEIYFNDDATYVLWAVRFHRVPVPANPDFPFAPVGFSRRSW